MFEDFKGKTALLTGATGGMGRAVAVALGGYGANVVIAARREKEGGEAVAEVEAAGGQALFVRTDVTKEAEAKDMVDKTIERFGGLDLVFNNAGSGVNTPITEMTTPQWDLDIAVNLTGTFYGLKAQMAVMQENGGSIVNMSSQTATYASPGYGAYAAAKAGVEALTRVAAIEGAAKNIRVNTVAPGVINTDILDTVPPELLKTLKSRIPMKRPGEVNEVADLVLYLMSPRSSFITGQNILVEGGFTKGWNF
ncbi:SDR family NAD(P)-dependent oxidoreductase [Roseobacter weihaiensis]|uniref:SDR family NAD(P)-dependent oxidoreductase n=1 Tax=Roseobacter weihaiensis TaxID=2763262 RepID=UPI001D0BB36C|nr:SDR family NAD(P)-dependent oxidoreductase [Roseobacter sp. H9]